MEHVCVKEEVINDIKDKIKNLADNDRKDYGVQKELSATIKLLAESNTDLKTAIVEISNTLVKVNTNMDLMASEIQNTNSRIDNLETKIERNDDLHTVDLREIQKEEVKLTLGQKVRKAVIPFTAISALLVALFELVKGFIATK